MEKTRKMTPGARVVPFDKIRFSPFTRQLGYLRSMKFRNAVAPMAGNRLDDYFLVLLLAKLIARDVTVVTRDGEAVPVSWGTLLRIMVTGLYRWAVAVFALLCLVPVALFARLAAFILIGRPSRLLYLANASRNDPLVKSHSLEALKLAGRKNVIMASFEPSASPAASAEDMASLCFRHDSSFFRMIARAAPWLVLNVMFRRVGVIHARSYGPAYLAALAKAVCGVKVVFDTRNEWLSEQAYFGRYRGAPWSEALERRLAVWAYGRADHVIATGEAHAGHITKTYATRRPPEIIRCSVDLNRFSAGQNTREETRKALGFGESRVIGYCGSAAAYQMPDRLCELLAAAQAARPDLRVLILSADADWFEATMAAAGADGARRKVLNASQTDLPRYLACMDMGLILREDLLFNNIAVPTKFAEYMAAGVPVFATNTMRDVDRMISDSGVGHVVPLGQANTQNVLSALDDVMAHRRERRDDCVKLARENFDLNNYVPVLRRLWFDENDQRPGA